MYFTLRIASIAVRVLGCVAIASLVLAKPPIDSVPVKDSAPLSDSPFASVQQLPHLTPRHLPPKTFVAKPDNNRFSAIQILVKFHEGTAIRARNGVWVVSSPPIASPSAVTLATRELNLQILDDDVKTANQIVATARSSIRRSFASLPESHLTKLKARGEQLGGKELADLNLYYFAILPEVDIKAATKMIADFADLRIVEQVYAQPIPKVMASRDIPPTTPDFTAGQTYFKSAPGGLDVEFARIFNGGEGEGTQIVDVEFAWDLDHEDLPGSELAVFSHGINGSIARHEAAHGTAVMGILAAQRNTFGVEGIAPKAGMGWSSVVDFRGFIFSGDAITSAAAALNAGDVILIEVGVDDPTANSVACINVCAKSECGTVPLEIYGADFSAIATTTALGINVVEAGANGSVNLNGYAAFDPTLMDSGALLVGASEGSGSNKPACFTNNGTRVDVYAWGDKITTTGFGNSSCNVMKPAEVKFSPGAGDVNQQYNPCFGGTSGASPMVAGAVALIQSIRAANGLPKLTPSAMRTLLKTTGTPQDPGVSIGTQPDLRKAITATLPDAAHGIELSMPTNATPGAAISGTVRFVNDGPLLWTRNDHSITCDWNDASPTSVNVAPFIGAPVQYHAFAAQGNWTGTAPSSLGSHTLQCDMVSTSTNASIGSIGRTVLVSQPGQLDASFVKFDLPKTMPHVAGSHIPPAKAVTIKVLNTGSLDWDGSLGVKLRMSGSMFQAPSYVSIPGTVRSNTPKTISMGFICPAAGNHTVTLQMAVGQNGFGHSITKTTNCTNQLGP